MYITMLTVDGINIGFDPEKQYFWKIDLTQKQYPLTDSTDWIKLVIHLSSENYTLSPIDRVKCLEEASKASAKIYHLILKEGKAEAREHVNFFMAMSETLNIEAITADAEERCLREKILLDVRIKHGLSGPGMTT
jgi:hypothetical protein